MLRDELGEGLERKSVSSMERIPETAARTITATVRTMPTA